MLPSTTIITSKAAICRCCKSLPMRGGEAPLRSWPPSNPSPKCLCISTQLWEQKLCFFYYISPNQSAPNHTHASEDKSKRKMSLSAERGVIPVSVTPVKGAALCESIFWQHYHAVLMLASNQTLSGGDKVTREWNSERKNLCGLWDDGALAHCSLLKVCDIFLWLSCFLLWSCCFQHNCS